ncbi:DUF4241 domain-containing protein [Brevibacillus brevis]|uniref:DUF4241 domain-containing protein n=1 Tax=Brevibacillus brevis TaxID=1393 RepID=UPI00165D9FFB|nr:DUF4241 domain-containing protein [Brevibacillus brevis]
MNKIPNEQWLARYEQKKQMLEPQVDLHAYFTSTEVSGKPINLLSLGDITIPSGDIIVRDPLAYLERNSAPYFRKVPTGTFPLTVCVVTVEEDHYRYAAAKVEFTDKTPQKFTEALLGDENLENLEEGEYFGFNVDAGLATVVDVKTRDAYLDFYDSWKKENPDGNIYDGYFADVFAQSYKDHPKYQRSAGDYINWRIPGTDLSIPMIQTGFGDGAYPVYFGIDENDQICQLVIQFICIELAFGEDDSEDEDHA